MADTDNTSQRVTAGVARLLAWYGEMGALGAFDEVPNDWRGRASGPGAGFEFAAPTNEPVASAGSPMPPGIRTRSPQPAMLDAPTLQPPGRRPSPAATHERPPAPPAALSARPVRAFDVSPGRRSGERPTPPSVGRAASDPGSARQNVPIQAATLAELGHALEAFEGCGLKSTAKNLCFYRGAELARVMVIGDAPGRDEDLAGKPFAGEAGALLDRMLAAIGLGEADVHMTNIVYWRPPGNRAPTAIEAQACRPYLDRQITLVAPAAILLLGGIAAKHMLGSEDGIMKLRGRWRSIECGGTKVKALATLHPAYLLLTPSAKRQAWRDLLQLREAIGELHQV